ncbi:MAG: DNA repair protein RecO, partial [Steroidobacterales bacterium]
MSAHPRRVLLAPGYVLHHWPYRDTSRILEVLARDHGRLTLFARGARGAKPRFGGVLQPFGLLLLSFHVGREAGQLTGAESGESVPPVPAGSLMAGFYLNELLLKLTTRHDPMVEVF